MPELDPLEFYGFLTPKVRPAICAVTTGATALHAADTPRGGRSWMS